MDEPTRWHPYPAAPWHMNHRGRSWTAMERFDEEQEKVTYLVSLVMKARDMFVVGDSSSPAWEQWMDETYAVVRRWQDDNR